MSNIEQQILSLAESSFFVVKSNGNITYASKGVYTFDRDFFVSRGIDAFDSILAESAKLSFSRLLEHALESHGERISGIYESINLEAVEESHYLKINVRAELCDGDRMLFMSVSDHTQIRVTEKRIKQREEELNLFGKIAFQKHLHDDDEILFRSILKIIIKTVPAEAALLYSKMSDDSNQLLIASQGLERAENRLALPAKIARITRVDYSDTVLPDWRKDGYKSQLVVPLVLHGDRVGTLVVLGYAMRSFSWVNIRLLRRVAEYISIMVSTEFLWRQKEQLAAITNDIFANSSDGLMIIDSSGFIEQHNPIAKDLLGENNTLVNGVQEDDRRAIKQFMRKIKDLGWAKVRATFKNDEKIYEITGSQIEGIVPKQYLCVARDISSWVDTQQSLKRKATKLKQVDKMKDEFISLVSHELRSPLTVIKGNSSLLKRTLNNKEDMSLWQAMDRNLNRLEKLVNDILDVTKLEYGDVSFEVVDVDIKELTKTIQEYVRRTAVEKKITISFDLKVGKIKNDPDRLYQIIRNLVDNSIKNIEQEGNIKITFKATAKDKIMITVKDDGPGLSAVQQKAIFDRFYRGQSTYSGSGLGLYIVSKLVRRMRGKISVKSEVGQGACFTIIIPEQL